MKRGELWTAAGAGYLSKPRPVLILQDDRYGQTDSVTVALLTSVDADAPLWRVEIPSSAATGLAKTSFVQIDKITTTRRTNLVQRVGVVPAQQMRQIERLLLAFLGLGGQTGN